ncbi:hypothetical protein E1B28_007866 [Marasmius oreades]|uniref:Uncharacterized protein n=1 Tax=Marasmius oreades TaxID=181124 RepID=A0A9P7UTX1_9AGAR|nr:uncharacterized protein E1B28_007866 [Marasmius oreades]KAG7094262.1 hypothetical protein E1B28_007866 [Marasmius oreades]
MGRLLDNEFGNVYTQEDNTRVYFFELDDLAGHWPSLWGFGEWGSFGILPSTTASLRNLPAVDSVGRKLKTVNTEHDASGRSHRFSSMSHRTIVQTFPTMPCRFMSESRWRRSCRWIMAPRVEGHPDRYSTIR